MKRPVLLKVIGTVIGVPLGLCLGVFIIYNAAKATGDETVLNLFGRIGIGSAAQNSATANTAPANAPSTGDSAPADEPSGSPNFLDYVEEKLKNLITPKPPLDGNLTPTRNLVGTWKSSLKGKGIQLYGSFQTETGNMQMYQDGDMEIVIDSVINNTATGKIRLSNVYMTAKATVPGRGSSTIPRTLVIKDTGYNPTAIRVSGARLDFGTFAANGSTLTMQGSYTTDLMSGTMTMPGPYGPIKGEFHLIRQK